MKIKMAALSLAVLMTVGILSGCSETSSLSSDDISSQDTSVVSSGFAPSRTEGDKANINVGVLKGPTAFGIVKLMEDDTNQTSYNDYNFTVATSPEEIVAKIITGEVDVGTVPTNTAASFYNKTEGKVQMAAIHTLGVLYILEKGNTIQSVADLKGKTIYASGLGATPEFVLNYVLEQNGIDPETDVTIVYKSEHSEVATLVASGEAMIALLPEPFVTSVTLANSDVNIAINITEEWAEIGEGSELVMGAMAVNTEFAENNKDAFNVFLDEYKESINYVNQNQQKGADLIEKYDIMKAAVAEKSISNCNIVYIDGDDMKTSANSYLGVLYNAEPTSIGGTLPDDNFYYKKD